MYTRVVFSVLYFKCGMRTRAISRRYIGLELKRPSVIGQGCAVCVAYVFVAGCGGEKSSVSPDLGLNRCSGALVVSVSASLTPTFIWSPPCQATNLPKGRQDAPVPDSAVWMVIATPCRSTNVTATAAD